MSYYGNISIQRRVMLFPVLVFLWLLGAMSPAMALTINLIDGSTNSNINLSEGFRWLIEEDLTKNIEPGVTCIGGVGVPGSATAGNNDCLAAAFHHSYMPVIAEGTEFDPIPVLDPNKRYYISVLPGRVASGSNYSMGGAQVTGADTTVDIVVNPTPLPTGQIRIFVYNDNHPVNNQADLPAEQGLAGFNLLLEDAGGKYGASAGHLQYDAFGNPLGTTYNPDGTVLAMGDGVITTDANGFAVINNLVPGKYGIQATPPIGSNWVQTSTIEGKKVIDAWVKANEPPFFTEFGLPGPHVNIGFVDKTLHDTSVLSGGANITGQIRSIHNSRPPNYEFYTGWPVSGCYVALNEVTPLGIAGKGLHVSACDDDSNFVIPDVPAGDYTLSIWDKDLLVLFAQHNVTVTADANGVAQDLNLLDVPVFMWFARLEQNVFLDLNENGIWDAGETPLFEEPTAIRWRDGTTYQGFPTDLEGAAPYDAVFPFFNWLVAEVGFGRYKATGATITVDAGGPLAPGDVLNPQPQSENAGGPNRTETGPVLTQAFQAFLGQTNIIDWGKKPYDTSIGENGGISGLVIYAITRAEGDPRFAAAEPWEPGIPRIQVELYQDADFDGVIDDIDGNPGVQRADVDNAPFNNFPGAEDFDYNSNGVFDNGDALQITTTDSWDDNLPSNCQNPNPEEAFSVDGVYPLDCYDGMRAFNQVRPGVFDGGYAFDGLTVGNYIVGSGAHPVYKTVKEEDVNVAFGDEFVQADLLPPVCVGEDHLVPNAFTLFDDGEQPLNAGTNQPLCDLKQVYLAPGVNAAAEFYMFTEVPITGHAVGFILDDASNEFDPNSPNFGEKYAPPFTPVSMRDWTGREIGRTYADRWGNYNMLLPSSYTVNVASPSGLSPNMITMCMNDPGPIWDDTTSTWKTDPYFRRQYSQFCYTFNFVAGSTTYLDTPVIPIAAYAGPDEFPVDCEYQDGTPVIWSTQSGGFNGPYVTAAGQSLTITSAGVVNVPNPDFGSVGEPKEITRDYGFGNTTGTVTIDGTPVTVTAWDNDSITITVPHEGQLMITRGDNGLETEVGITVTVGGSVISVAPGTTIQDAIDVAPNNSTILVPPGYYEELVIMWKPVKLQGSGASTVIDAVKSPGEKLLAWRTRIEQLTTGANPAVDLLPAQEIGFGLPEPDTFVTEDGPGIIVLAKDTVPFRGGYGLVGGKPNARIDGLSVTGADGAGGIFINAYANFLQVSNNRIYSNHGVLGGGIRAGHPFLVDDTTVPPEYQYADNKFLNIHHNWVAGNGSNGGVGGGISLNHGSHAYKVTENYVCGNFTQGHGAGIGHFGLNTSGLIEDNTILFNQSFNQSTTATGGGIAIIGAPSLDETVVSPGLGAGNVKVISNLIQGNNTGAGDGAGISLVSTNGEDVANFAASRWYKVDLLNNIIVNNIAGYAGGGIAMKDAVLVNIVNNTIAHNDSTATAGAAFPAGSPNESVNQIGGIVSYAHSPELEATINPLFLFNRYRHFAQPKLENNIIWQNRSFHFVIDNGAVPSTFGLIPNMDVTNQAVFDDMGVIGYPGGQLNPRYSVLTDISGYDTTNISADPDFVLDYFNGAAGHGQTIQQLELTTAISVAPAFDEGGNFISVRFGPYKPSGDYHLNLTSPAIDAGNTTSSAAHADLAVDYDNDPRPQGASVDMGADEAN